MAKSLIIKRRRHAAEWEVNRYARSIGKLETRKSNRGGILGISRNGKRWKVIFPKYLRLRKKSYELALTAAMEYNSQMLALFGEDAVLCDVQAAIELDKRKVKRK